MLFDWSVYMELRELKSFCTAAKLHSISRAAEALGVGQPTVTTHIKKLEEELGKMLFDRVRRPIQLTLAGEGLAEMATPLVEGIDSLADMTTEAEKRGPVYVASTPDIIPENYEALDFEGLFLYERVLITPANHPLTRATLTSIEQIAQFPLIMMGMGTYTREILEEEFRRKGVEYDIVVELDSMDMIKRYVALGMGISVGPRLAIDPQDRRDLGVMSLANLLPVEQAGIIRLRGKNISEPTQNFISVMRDVLAPASSTRK